MRNDLFSQGGHSKRLWLLARPALSFRELLARPLSGMAPRHNLRAGRLSRSGGSGIIFDMPTDAQGGLRLWGGLPAQRCLINSKGDLFCGPTYFFGRTLPPNPFRRSGYQLAQPRAVSGSARSRCDSSTS